MTQSYEISSLLQHVTTGLHRRTDQALQEQLGIGVAQLNIMRVLQSGPLTQRHIADQLSQTEAAVSRQVKLLVAKRVLMTKVNPLNKRERMSALTAKGKRLTIAAEDLLDRYTDPLFATINEKQQRQLMTALEALHPHTCRAGVAKCEHTFQSLYDAR